MAHLYGQTRSGRTYSTDPYVSGQPRPEFGQPRPEFGQPRPEFGQPRPDFGQPRPELLRPDLPAATSIQPQHRPGIDSAHDVSDCLTAIQSMVKSVPPSTEFEKNIVNCVNLLIARMGELQREVEGARTYSVHLKHELHNVEKSIVKTEQYSRRDCVTVTGLAKAEGETNKDLGPKVVSALSKSGVTVKIEDLSAYHRNGVNVKHVKLSNGREKVIPPSVTVKFKSINQKDELIKNYKNFDVDKSKPEEVQVYHSLTPHYSGLRRDILKFFKDNPAAAIKGAKWVKYLSPTSGLAVKMKTDEFMKGIHSWDDFMRFFHHTVQSGS